MEELFATKILIYKLLNIEGFEIPLSETERKHLIITGKNGSGKTTLLRDLKYFFTLFTNLGNNKFSSTISNINKFNFENKQALEIPGWIEGEDRPKDYLTNINYSIQEKENYFKNELNLGAYVDINLPETISSEYKKGNFIIAFFEAKRNRSLNNPSGINKVALQEYYTIEDNPGIEFIQYIVNLKADQAFAKEDMDIESARKIDEWFSVFEQNLFELFDYEGAELQFDRKKYNFNIIEKDKPPYSLNQLSDGYAAIFDIVSELIMRMEEHKVKNYDVQGIVLIDEVETHLHIALQKKILPFLTAFFPKVQFIVTTHSPFVINSIKDAVICDLENRIVETDLSAYPYEAIVENYFEVDQYSDEIKKEVKEFEKLLSMNNLDGEGQIKLNRLEERMTQLQTEGNDELAVKIQQIKLKYLNKK